MADAIIMNIRHIMKLECISRLELSKGININFNYLSSILDGNARITNAITSKIADYLQVSLNEINYGLSSEREQELSTFKDKKFLYELLKDYNFNIPYDDLLPNIHNLSKTIKLFCFVKGLTVKELSIKANFPMCCMYSNNFSVSNLQNIAKALDISVKQLVFGFSKEEELLITDIKSIGKNVKVLLEKKNLSYLALSSLTGLNVSTICNIVGYGRCCSADSIKRIADALDVSITDIIFSTYAENIESSFVAEELSA